MDIEVLARIQFAFTAAFHYIYPPLSIGLGLLMVIFEGLYLRTGNLEYKQLTRFWLKIFAIVFGIGVATGIIMEFEFGTNWSVYSKYVGDIFGSALAAEGLFAFGLESTFLGILIFGWNRVSPKVHFISTIGVFVGSLFSAVWIVVANSWQQTPSGYHIVGTGMNARAEVTDFWAMVFNPSSMDRIVHVWQGALLAGAFMVLSVHAYYLIKGKFIEVSKKAFKIALVVATVVSFSQLYSGHRSADLVARLQPAKLAAMEGHYAVDAAADLYLFGWVNQKDQTVSGLGIPGGLSLLVHFDPNHKIKGLNAFPEDERPKQVNGIFQVYHIMISIGMFLIALTSFAVYQWWKGKLFTKRWLLKLFVGAVFLPQIANQTGWFTAEMGRQPWVVYGHLKTNEAFSQEVAANQVLFSLILFFIVYAVLFLLFIYSLNKKIKHGPEEISPLT